ncbi:hypothetical protein [Yoonia sp. 2307UL14-13]|uniref:hypothetical protein n=1 Tax=Yoonia sp. 2307UL14-13 TaxID=3126506 RepID=UPI0030A5C89F
MQQLTFGEHSMDQLTIKFADDPMLLGYLFGIADMAYFQTENQQPEGVSALDYIAAFFDSLMGLQSENVMSFAMSARVVPAFDQGRRLGADELANWIKTQGQFIPMGLANRLM